MPWIAGIFAQGAARLAWWTVAVALDYAGGHARLPDAATRPGRVPRPGGRGRASGAALPAFLIIAVGETILLSGIQFSPYGFERDRTAALLVSFAITVLLWQIYFYRAGELLPAAIASSRAPAHVGELASYSHVVMVIGVGLSAVSDKLAILHPVGHTEPAWIWVIFGGPALFLIGRALLNYVTFSRVSWSLPIGLLLLAALAPATLRLPPVMVAVVATAVLAGIAVSNAASWRLFPQAPAPPPGRPS